jgi:Ca2+-transporting ATPase
LSKGLALAALGLVALVFLLGILRGEELHLMLLTSVSMAVAAIPEGLPAVVTVALALGSQRMLKRRTLVRKLPAVEGLGSVTVICSDKTGTLTENRMTVTVLDVAGHRIDLVEELERDGRHRFGSPCREPDAETIQMLRNHPALLLLLAGGALSNDALLECSDDNYEYIGDPTEGAFVVAAARAGLMKDTLEETFSREAEVPFDSDRKRMTTVHKFPASEGEIPPEYSDVWNWSGYVGEFPYIVFSKGAVDSLLEISDKVWVEDRVEELNDSWRQRIVDANEEQARNGMRVLGVATRTLDKIPDKVEQKELEVGLIFIGMVSMIDPARPEVKDSIRTCKTAGIRPVMITGDHPLTAEKIANELGISSSEGILTGQDLSNIPLTELNNIVNKVNVFARVSPEHKLNIVTAMQNNGQIVAMTGDGVNDAPALNKADIGVAMGITGTDVAKEAADIVLLDDNFATIVAAVEEGRRIYDNIRKFFKFLMASNAGEIWVMIIAPLIGMPFPLLPLQILWINLVTDGFPGLALGVEPAEKDIMRRPPYPPNESIFARGVARQIIWVGIFMGLVSLGIGYAYWSIGHPDWQTMVFTTLTLSQMGNALAFRSEKDSIFKIGLLSNKSMVQAISLTLVLQLFVLYIPFLQRIFNTTPLSPIDLFVCVIASLAVLLGVEIDKWISRMREKREQKELIA